MQSDYSPPGLNCEVQQIIFFKNFFMKYGQELPKEVEEKLDKYIERIKSIKWFKPNKDLKKEVVEKQVSLVLEAFGVKGKIEYRQLKTVEDWDAAWDAAWDAVS